MSVESLNPNEAVVTTTRTVRYWIEPRTVYVIHRDDGKPRTDLDWSHRQAYLGGDSWKGSESTICDSLEEAQARMRRITSREATR